MAKEQKDTRQILLATAMELIALNSYASVSVEEICKKAGVQKGSFYHFFPSKSGLAEAAFQTHWDEISKRYDHVFSPQYSGLERFDRYCSFIYDLQKQNLDKYGKVVGCAYATFGAEMSTQNETFRKLTEEIFKKKRVYFESALRDAAANNLIPRTHIAEKAAEINAYSLGVLLTAKIQNNIEVIRQDLKQGIYRILGISGDNTSELPKLKRA